MIVQYPQFHHKKEHIENLGKGNPIHILRLFDMDISGHTHQRHHHNLLNKQHRWCRLHIRSQYICQNLPNMRHDKLLLAQDSYSLTKNIRRTQQLEYGSHILKHLSPNPLLMYSANVKDHCPLISDLDLGDLLRKKNSLRKFAIL